MYAFNTETDTKGVFDSEMLSLGGKKKSAVYSVVMNDLLFFSIVSLSF